MSVFFLPWARLTVGPDYSAAGSATSAHPSQAAQESVQAQESAQAQESHTSTAASSTGSSAAFLLQQLPQAESIATVAMTAIDINTFFMALTKIKVKQYCFSKFPQM